MEVKFFILEDDQERVKHFVQRFRELKSKGVEVSYKLTDKADRAIDMLSKEEFDIIFLDHDLGGEVYVDTNHENTGSEVARFINGSELEFKNTQCIIHSMNTPAARHMNELIETKIPSTHRVVGVWFPEVFHRVLSFE